jgi:DNA ligase-4
LGEHLDAVIIGASFGNGARGQHLASFLLGVRDDQAVDQDAWLTFCSVGTGFSLQELAGLLS